MKATPTGMSTDAYAFLDISRPHVAWAVYRGVLITPQPTPMDGGELVSWWFADLMRTPTHLDRELALERLRKHRFPERVSRMAGMFCFPRRDFVDQAIRERWGSHYKSENLAELSLIEAQGYHQWLDANWISHCGFPGNRDTDWMNRYWSGEEYPDARPVWEILVEGNVTVLGTDLRERAYTVVKDYWPDSLMFLEISRLGAWIGSSIGTINVFMTYDKIAYHFNFIMDMSDANDTVFLDRLGQLIAGGHPVNHADIGPHYEQGSFERTPNMTQYRFSVLRQPAP